MHCGAQGGTTTKSLSNDQEEDVARMHRMKSDRCRPKLVFSIRLAADWGRYRKASVADSRTRVLQAEGCDGNVQGAPQSHEDPIVGLQADCEGISRRRRGSREAVIKCDWS